MRYGLPCGWALACLLVTLLTCSCQHNQECCSTCETVVTLAPPAPLSGDVKILPTTTTQQGGEEHSELPRAVTHGMTLATNPAPMVPSASHMGHDPEYHWLVGTLEFSRYQQATLLRYTSADQDDRYGGSVTLLIPNRMNNYKPGQVVRVEGSLIDPGSQQMQPAFVVTNISAVP